MIVADEKLTLSQRRNGFVGHLYTRYEQLSDPGTERAARAELARLRRGLSGGRSELDAFGIVQRQDAPRFEESVWLLTAVMFALTPQGRPDNTTRYRSLGGAMAMLAQSRGDDAVARRFRQLVGATGNALPHELRQTMRLLNSDGIKVDFFRLLSDLLKLRLPGRERATTSAGDQDVRLDWSRDFYRGQP